MGRHAYLILAHKNPGQVQKLIDLLDDSRNDIFLHVDRKAKDFSGREFSTKRAGLFPLDNTIRVNWGGLSLMKAELRLLQAATEQGHYDYYHLISGQDLPIKSQNEIHNFFDLHYGREFLNLWKMDESAMERTELVTLFPEGERRFYIHAVNSLYKKLQRALGIRRKHGLIFKFGSNWFSITDNLARYTLAQADILNRMYRHTNNCDELFLSTLVWYSPFRDNLFDPGEASPKDKNLSFMRYIDWDREGLHRHPWTFRADDYETLMAVPHLFARKFDENVDGEIIDMIYNKLKQS